MPSSQHSAEPGPPSARPRAQQALLGPPTRLPSTRHERCFRRKRTGQVSTGPQHRGWAAPTWPWWGQACCCGEANGAPNTEVNKGFNHRHRSCPWGACGQQAKGVQILQTRPPVLIHGSPPACLGSSGCQGRQDTRSPLRCTCWASVPPVSPIVDETLQDRNAEGHLPVTRLQKLPPRLSRRLQSCSPISQETSVGIPAKAMLCPRMAGAAAGARGIHTHHWAWQGQAVGLALGETSRAGIPG